MKVDYKQRVCYYSDLLNDDFAGNDLEAKPLPDNFVYERKNVFFKVFSFLFYYTFAVPILLLIQWFSGVKVIGKHHLKKIKTGYFIYGNHTKWMDAIIPSPRLTFPRYTYMVSKTDALDIPFVRHLVQALGMFPLPTSYERYPEFFKAIENHLAKKRPIVVYPEAHIWPFYTDVRPFPSSSFRYPAKYNVPVVPFFTIYRKNRGLWRLLYKDAPRMTLHIGEPFYPDPNKSLKENTEYLSKATYDYMCHIRDTVPSVKYIDYIFVEKSQKKINN